MSHDESSGNRYQFELLESSIRIETLLRMLAGAVGFIAVSTATLIVLNILQLII